jgi:diadenosine tetraphosphate (Ap4A) HIT family hydrolase
MDSTPTLEMYVFRKLSKGRLENRLVRRLEHSETQEAADLAVQASPWSNRCMDERDCHFCRFNAGHIRLANQFAVAVLDQFPVTPGHTLVVPKRHVASLFDLPEQEQAALWRQVVQVRTQLLSELTCDGFNVGLNDGPSAGQTVMHSHIHVIPRRHGDVADPRGGVRWVIPGKAAYWAGGREE